MKKFGYEAYQNSGKPIPNKNFNEAAKTGLKKHEIYPWPPKELIQIRSTDKVKTTGSKKPPKHHGTWRTSSRFAKPYD